MRLLDDWAGQVPKLSALREVRAHTTTPQSLGRGVGGVRPSEIEIKNMFEKLTEPDDEDENDVTAEDLMEKIRKHDDVQRKSPSPADQKWIAEEAVRSGVTLDAQAWSPITKGAWGCADPPSGWGVHAVQPQGT